MKILIVDDDHLMLEATIGLNEVEDEPEAEAAPEELDAGPFTQSDLHFLKSLRIALPEGAVVAQAGAHRGFYRPHGGFPAWEPSDDARCVAGPAWSQCGRWP